MLLLAPARRSEWSAWGEFPSRAVDHQTRTSSASLPSSLGSSSAAAVLWGGLLVKWLEVKQSVKVERGEGGWWCQQGDGGMHVQALGGAQLGAVDPGRRVPYAW